MDKSDLLTSQPLQSSASSPSHCSGKILLLLLLLLLHNFAFSKIMSDKLAQCLVQTSMTIIFLQAGLVTPWQIGLNHEVEAIVCPIFKFHL